MEIQFLYLFMFPDALSDHISMFQKRMITIKVHAEEEQF